MPHPAQVHHDQIITVARDLFEVHGYDGVTMTKLAEALGIRASSLYKHFDDKNALLKAINTLTLTELTHAMKDAIQSGYSPYGQCMAMAMAYWEYAHAHPMAYHLALEARLNASPDAHYLEQLALPLQEIFSEVIGEFKSLQVLRGAWAVLHGFVSLHIGGRFRRGGDVYEAYLRAFAIYLAGWGIK